MSSCGVHEPLLSPTLAQHGARPLPMALPIPALLVRWRKLSLLPGTYFWLVDAENWDHGSGRGWVVVYMCTHGETALSGSDAAVTGDRPISPTSCKNALTKPLSQESNAPVDRELWGSEAWNHSWLRFLKGRAYGLLLIRTCPHFGASTPGDPTRIRPKDNLKVLMLAKEIGVRTFWSSWKFWKSLPFPYWITVYIYHIPIYNPVNFWSLQMNSCFLYYQVQIVRVKYTAIYGSLGEIEGQFMEQWGL